LEFTITPDLGDFNLAASFTVWQFSKDHKSRNPRYPQAKWILLDSENAKRRGYSTLPYHKFTELIVIILAPNPENHGQLYRIWQKATELVKILGSASEIPSLAISLRKRDTYSWGQDWGPHCYDHDFVTVPFCTLRNIKTMSIDSRPENMDIDWTTMNWAWETVEDRSWNQCDSSKYSAYDLAENDVDRKVAHDWSLSSVAF